VSLLIAFILVMQSGEPPVTGPDMGILIRGTASADLREGLSTLSADTVAAFPEASWMDDMFELEVSARMDYPPDTQEVTIEPLTAGAFFRWPGSPWISAGVFRGIRDPFVYGVSEPVVEWNSTGSRDMNGASLEAGGVLGFSGWWNRYSDSLSWCGISSPWLGFAQVKWDRLGSDSSSSSLDNISGFADLRFVQPWLSFSSHGDTWSGEGELRGWKPVSNAFITLEIVPMASWASDTLGAGLGAYLKGRSRSFSGYFRAFAPDLDNAGDASLSAGFDMLSQAGVNWSMNAFLDEMESPGITASGMYRASPAGCGALVYAGEDTLAVTVSALYSPVRGVSSALSVYTDLDSDSPDPGCALEVHGAGSMGLAGIRVSWSRDITELRLGVSAWID